jgi:hypothetical protein
MCYKTKHQAPKFTKIVTANFYILLQIIFIYFNIAHINYVHRSYGQYIHIPEQLPTRGMSLYTIWLSTVSFIFPVLLKGNDYVMKTYIFTTFSMKTL